MTNHNDWCDYPTCTTAAAWLAEGVAQASPDDAARECQVKVCGQHLVWWSCELLADTGVEPAVVSTLAEEEVGP
jgi:hypothetical protein